MKNRKLLLVTALCTLIPLCVTGCDKNKEENSGSISIVNDEKDTHYLKFIENNAEVLRMVVIKTDTYDNLLPYFPTLTQEEGYIKYWDGDYEYTNYSKENQFKVWDKNDLIIDLYSYSRKI